MHAKTASERLDGCNVVWDSPSLDAAGSMPMGNGEVGVNLWVGPDGAVHLYLSRTDAWSEASRLLKLGEVRVNVSPPPYRPGVPFRHELVLKKGLAEIRLGTCRMVVLVEADAPVVDVSVTSEDPVTVSAELRVWRNERHVLQGEEQKSSWTMHSAPPEIEVWESADVVRPAEDRIDWYHRNAWSVVPMTLKHQGLELEARSVQDPIKDRTFGGSLWGEGFRKVSASAIESGPGLRHLVRIATDSRQCEGPEEFLSGLSRLRNRALPFDKALQATADWWQAFWSRSWIYVQGESTATVPENKHTLRAGSDSGGGSAYKGLMGALLVLPTDWPPAQVKAAAAKGAAQESVTPLDPSKAVTTVDPETGRTCLVFNGRGVELAGPPSYEDGVTLGAWIKPDELGGRIFDKVTPGGSDGFLFDTYGGRLRAVVGHKTIVGPELKVGTWQHVAMTYSASTGRLSLFLDGQQVAGDGPFSGAESPLTQAYVLQRWVTACGGRGKFPIKFNGSIFTVEPNLSDGPDFNADWRRWGDCFWWQNTRFPYASMPARGDRDMMEPLYRMYEDALGLCRIRAKAYYGAEGAYFPETMTIFGAYSNGDYGWDRKGHGRGEVLCPWWQWAWQQGLELVSLMLDDYETTLDASFLKARLLPMAREVLAYYRSRFHQDASGKLVISPTQSAETYWHDVVNDTPSVAGIRSVTERLLALDGLSGPDRKSFKSLAESCPQVPLGRDGGGTFIAPAEKYKDERSNVENTEFYAIWPFRIFGLGRSDIDVARETYRRRIERSRLGWQYDGQVAAIAGLTDDAAASLMAKIGNSNPKHRFPAIWGPNYDWLPDQCHGGNIMITLQEMAMQCAGGKIYLLPSWPLSWNVSLKLHAPGKTVIELDYQDRKVVRLKVSPESRMKDVVLPSGLRSDKVR